MVRGQAPGDLGQDPQRHLLPTEVALEVADQVGVGAGHKVLEATERVTPTHVLKIKLR